MQKTILVPVDFSEHAIAAVKYAAMIARARGLSVHLMHAFSSLRSSFQSELANETDRQRAKLGSAKNMDSFLSTLQTAGYDNIQHTLFNGSISNGLIHCQNENHIVLVVMGTKGRSGLAAGFFGSNALELATQINVPLLIVPTRLKTLSFDRPLFFTDFQQGDERTLHEFSKIVANEKRSCMLVHITGGDHEHLSDERAKLEQYAQELEMKADNLTLRSEVFGGKENLDSVSKAIELYEANIILLTIVRRENFFENLMAKSLAKAIILNPSEPVLIVAKETVPKISD